MAIHYTEPCETLGSEWLYIEEVADNTELITVLDGCPGSADGDLAGDLHFRLPLDDSSHVLDGSLKRSPAPQRITELIMGREVRLGR